MNWLVFAAATWVMFGLEIGLRDALQIGDLNISPHFAVILLVFVAMWASSGAALASGVMIGIGLDLFYQLKLDDGSDVVVIGPHALGCMLAAYAVVNLRALMFRKNVLSIAFLSLVAAALMQIVATALLTARASYDPLVFGPAFGELGQRLGSAVYTAIVAFPLGFVLNLLRGAFRFQSERGSGFRIR